ncbi:NADH-quinone reductase [Glaciecola sp. XM2]|jgi:hypothetical protein|uniref:DUF6482 family protein n=1 Tax=Glaciecola sp. XM2 TaxID=1914931 RepID=UPI001BDE2324|nr:DUF6482 family protein [Glaciecola sp. XM2]MBT1451498.1 NADH-quinone reductase [Glaciecola sp. XM2]
MHKFYIKSIAKTPMHITKLEVQSFEMNVYLVKLYTSDGEGFVFDDKDRPMRFHNSQQVRDTFEHCEVDQAVMVHDSPYDEMIGNPNKAEPSMSMPFSMQQPY